MRGYISLPLVFQLFWSGSSGQENYTYKAQNYYTYLSYYKYDGNTSITDLIPKANLSEPIEVNISMVLHALFDFDEVGGSLEMSVSVKLLWYDEMVDIFLGTGNYGLAYTLSADESLNSILVRYDRMWTPKLVLGNTVDEFSRIGDPAYMCRYNLSNGMVTWQPKFLLKSTCSPDVTYYPFDKQDCTFTILSWGYTSNEVVLTSMLSEWDLSAYEGNGEWDIEETGAGSYQANSQSVFELKISLKRNPLYFAFNIIIPVIAISLLNGVVFWLPVDSGERVGFSITCFLTFMVLLSTILGYLPASSGTMSYLCYYVVVMMIFSGMVTAFVVINLHLYHKEEQDTVPWCLKAFIRFWRFHWFVRLFRRKSKSGDGDSTRSETPVVKVDEQETETHSGKPKIVLSESMMVKIGGKMEKHPATEAWRENDDVNKEEIVTWKDFSSFLDKFLFLAFLSTEAFFSITFLVPLAYRQ